MRRDKKDKHMSESELDDLVAKTDRAADETMRLALDSLDRGLAEARSTRHTARRFAESVRKLDLTPLKVVGRK